jgi:hypothetical protein
VCFGVLAKLHSCWTTLERAVACIVAASKMPRTQAPAFIGQLLEPQSTYLINHDNTKQLGQRMYAITSFVGAVQGHDVPPVGAQLHRDQLPLMLLDGADVLARSFLDGGGILSGGERKPSNAEASPWCQAHTNCG